MSDILIIFFLIGLAHWATHVIHCKGCHQVAGGVLISVMEGVRYTFGWPIMGVMYLVDLNKKETPPQVIEISQRVGESKAEFEQRLQKEIMNGVEEMKAKTRKNMPGT